MIARRFLRAGLFLAVLLGGGLARAQAPADPQAAVEPRGGPGAGQKLLARMAGDWDVAKAFFPARGGPVRTAGRCRQTMIHGGRFLQSECTFGEGPAATTGLGLIGFDESSGAFTSVWTDSRSPRVSLRRSELPFDGELIVLASRSLGDAAGPETRSTRTVTRLLDGDRRIVHQQFALAPGADDRLMMELVMTRRPASQERP